MTLICSHRLLFLLTVFLALHSAEASRGRFLVAILSFVALNLRVNHEVQTLFKSHVTFALMAM